MSTTPKRPRGRPEVWNQASADEIAARLAEGEPLAQICRDEHMPSAVTAWRWQNDRPEFAKAIADARAIGFDRIALDCLHIADANGQDTRYVGGEGAEREVADSDWIARSKLRVETRLKLLAKWDPRRYGDKLQHVGGAEGDAPINHSLAIEFVAAKPEDV